MQTSSSMQDEPILTRKTLLRELLAEIRSKRLQSSAKLRKYVLLSRAFTILIGILNVITLISLTLLFSLDNSEMATIVGLVNHAIAFLFSTLLQGSDLQETLMELQGKEKSLVSLDREMSLLLARNHLTPSQQDDIYQEMVDRLASTELTKL